jgi:glycine/D-amino acid oxidase-like deaminating enzyme
MSQKRTAGHNAVSARPPVERACYWLASRGRPAGPPLEGRHEADVAIVGGGLTGLWTAISLKALVPSLPVVVLEQGTAAYGASGRNAGILAESIDHSHDLAIAHFGLDEARRLARLGQENVARMLRFLDDHGIACDLERTGTLVVALVASHVEELRHAHERARALGVTPPRLLSAEEVRAEIHCDRYQGGLLVPGGAILDPVKLTEGLKREAERRGVAVFEQTRVTGIDTAGLGVRLQTPGGAVRARKAVLATSAYSHHLLPRLRFRFIPFYDYIITSEPLTTEQKAAIGWGGRQGVADARTFFKYYRLTADDRVLWGTSEAAYYRGNRVDEGCDHSERHYRELQDSFRRHFPALADLEFPYAWGGAICATTRFTPFFGSAHDGRVLYGLGYTGHGLGTTHLAGEILAHMALGRPSPLLDLKLVRRKPFPYPPEPLRSLAVAAVTNALRRVDAGGRPSFLLRCLDAMGIGLSS